MFRPLSALAAAAAALCLLAAAGRAEPDAIDDDEYMAAFVERLGALAKAGKCLAADKLAAGLADRRCTVRPSAPAADRLDPEDVYERALESVYVVGSVVPSEDNKGEYEVGRLGTAWVLSADGVMVSCRHVFAEPEGDHFGVCDRAGRVLPVVEVLACDKVSDLCVFRVAAAGLKPLPLAAAPARVGSWVGVLGHPGDQMFTFSQGHVSRYSRYTNDDGRPERWMSVTAEFAVGSSGAPVLDRRGAVVGVAALTFPIDAPPEEAPAAPAPEKKDDAPEKKGDKPAAAAEPKEKPKPLTEPQPPAASTVQMVVKQASPVALLRRLLDAGKND